MTEEPAADDLRQHWLAILARAGRTPLEQALARIGNPSHSMVRMPECGMVMLRGRVGGTGDAFNLGEATVTRCAARVGEHLGIGYVLGRDRRQAELVAVLDAVLQDASRRAAVLREVVDPLGQAQQERRDDRSRESASSRVEFFTMVREAT